MMDEPSIKGTLFQGLVDDLQSLIAAGRLSAEDIEARLDAEQVAIVLDRKVAATEWYDIKTYHLLAEVIREVEGGDAHDYWFERGRRAAKRLTDMGIYQQLDYLGRTDARKQIDPQARFDAFGRDMKLVMTLHTSMLNFGDWSCIPEPDGTLRYRVEIRGIEGVADGLFIAAAGLFSGLGEQHRGGLAWRFSRPEPDCAVIAMQGDL